MSKCDPKDIAIKSFFLGPQAENAPQLQKTLDKIFRHWFDWRRSLFPEDGQAISPDDQLSPQFKERVQNTEREIERLLKMYQAEVPKFSPRYIGHMFSEISLPALCAEFITLLHNPNNISGEASKVGLTIEREAIGALAHMVGFDPRDARGHFTSGGTLANFEGLVRARERMAQWLALGARARAQGIHPFEVLEAAHMGWERFEQLRSQIQSEAPHSSPIFSPDPFHLVEAGLARGADALTSAFHGAFNNPIVLIPENKHYSWVKGVSLLGLGEESLWPVALDRHGHLSLKNLRMQIDKALLHNHPIMAIVSVTGTTELGVIDPVFEIQEALQSLKNIEGLRIWHHNDAAYGGFFCTLVDMEEAQIEEGLRHQLQALKECDSITLDPHKLGYIPFGCGTFLTRDRRDYALRGFGGPYVRFDLEEGEGLYTIEGSRSAAGATATWLTARTIGLDRQGLGRVLDRTIKIRRELEAALSESNLPIRPIAHSDTNILCFAVCDPSSSLSDSNAWTESIYDTFHPTGNGPFFVSKTTLNKKTYGELIKAFVRDNQLKDDADHLVSIRLCLMNPFIQSQEMHIDLISEFIKKLSENTSRRIHGTQHRTTPEKVRQTP